jgi:hypothetical protein
MLPVTPVDELAPLFRTEAANLCASYNADGEACGAVNDVNPPVAVMPPLAFNGPPKVPVPVTLSAPPKVPAPETAILVKLPLALPPVMSVSRAT